MTTLLDERNVPRTPVALPSASDRLRAETTAVRIQFNWFGTRKTLSNDQVAQAADTFGAEHKSLSASKRLLDAKHPAFKAVTAVKTKATAYWKSVSLPFPEPGVRLIRRSQVDSFNQQMLEFQQDLAEAAQQLQYHYDELRDDARNQLGELFDPDDYPVCLQDMFAVSWDFPNLQPPPYLQRLAPESYQLACQQATARFNEAVELAEASFLEELRALVAHLTERLSGQGDGRAKVFRDSAVENITDFLRRFQQLNIGSSAQLDELVAQCRDVVQGVEPQQLRDNTSLRTQVAADLGQLRDDLDSVMVDRPRRNILRRSR